MRSQHYRSRNFYHRKLNPWQNRAGLCGQFTITSEVFFYLLLILITVINLKCVLCTLYNIPVQSVLYDILVERYHSTAECTAVQYTVQYILLCTVYIQSIQYSVYLLYYDTVYCIQYTVQYTVYCTQYIHSMLYSVLYIYSAVYHSCSIK